MQTELEAIFRASIAAKEQFLQQNGTALERVIRRLAKALDAGNKLLLFGNGGSAADAQHIAAELVGRFRIDRRPLPAIALTTDTSALTSIANDFGYAEVFAKQVQALARRGDVAIALSTSGNSESILRAVQACRTARVHTVGLTGGTGGKLGKLVDDHLNVGGTTETARIQETHILVGHAICDMVDRILFGSAPRRPPKPGRRPGSGGRRRRAISG